MRVASRILALLVLLYAAAWAYRIYSRDYYIWLPGYAHHLLNGEHATRGPVHLFFYYTDHFEPGGHFDRVQHWVDEYPKLAARHRDADGRVVQHCWFYPAEQPIDRNLDALHKLAAAGYGEIELHLHHGNDTPQSARVRFEQGIAWMQRHGFLKGTDGQTHFAFIHGNWGLDNSRGARFCGNNVELCMLHDLGCFADYTFPSLWQVSQPPYVDAITSVTDDQRDKSYDRGVPLRLGYFPPGDLVEIQGPLVIAPELDPRRLFFDVEDGDIHPAVPAGPRRAVLWVRANIHVRGRPDWVFIKVHGHAASSDADMNETLGPHFESALSYLETHYNDGRNYVLHYVTAREVYNLIRAAVDGKRGDPRQYYNYVIPPYAIGND